MMTAQRQCVDFISPTFTHFTIQLYNYTRFACTM